MLSNLAAMSTNRTRALALLMISVSLMLSVRDSAAQDRMLQECGTGLGKVLLLPLYELESPFARGSRVDNWIDRCPPRFDKSNVIRTVEHILKTKLDSPPLGLLVVVPPGEGKVETDIELEFFSRTGTQLGTTVIPFDAPSRQDFYAVTVDDPSTQSSSSPFVRKPTDQIALIAATALSPSYQMYRDWILVVQRRF